MIYNEGKIIVRANDPVVTGVGTRFLTELPSRAVLMLPRIVGAWPVIEVLSNTELRLSGIVRGLATGAVLTFESYAISADFTPTIQVPYPNHGEIDNAAVLERTFAGFDRMVPIAD